jgi:predicted Zn finger-like uncharacterized protein
MKMIIECEECLSKFVLDESRLKAEGSKVKCSVCKHVFIAYPVPQTPPEAQIPDTAVDEDLEETLPLDTGDASFDLAYEKAVPVKSLKVEREEAEEAIPSVQPGGEEQVSLEESTAVPEEELETDVDDAEAIVSKKRQGRSRMPILVASIIILIILIGISSAKIYSFFRGSSERQESSDPGVARLKFRAPTGTFIESDTAGQLYVIKGMVINDYPEPRSYILIKGSIQDDTGKTVKIDTAYAGNSFSEKEIKVKSIAELKEAQKNRLGHEKTNVNIPSGGTIPFMIIFDKLPENMAEFTVEAVSSDPEK